MKFNTIIANTRIDILLEETEELFCELENNLTTQSANDLYTTLTKLYGLGYDTSELRERYYNLTEKVNDRIPS